MSNGFPKAPPQASLNVLGFSRSSCMAQRRGEEDPAPCREGAGPAGSPANGKQLQLPTPAQP